jgi:hypothetical protein
MFRSPFLLLFSKSDPPARALHAMRHTFAVETVRRGGSVFHPQKAKCRGAFGSGVPTLRQNSVTILLPFLAHFGAIGDESRRKRTRVSVAQVEHKARII